MLRVVETGTLTQGGDEMTIDLNDGQELTITYKGCKLNLLASGPDTPVIRIDSNVLDHGIFAATRYDSEQGVTFHCPRDTSS